MKTFATKIINLKGWTRADAIFEIMGIDNVSEKEATRRYDNALQSKINRSVAMKMSHDARKQGEKDGRRGIINDFLWDKYKAYKTGYFKTIKDKE